MGFNALFVITPAWTHQADFHGAPISCIAAASRQYGVPKRDIIALMQNEGAAPGIAAHDSNGTTDLGPMQVNTCHLPLLRRFGYTYQTLKYNACANVMAGTWVFAQCLAQTGNLLNAAACYNAGVGAMPIAWQNGYVARFAAHLGLQIPDSPIPQEEAIPAGLVVLKGRGN
ncbi:Lytic transglycosylase catalytic [Acidithiobacillus ferrivorans SS3]|uniref:Lytic transglycosylase catalytic n=1 Tax=Acidithiobacillus ferrivorans SS3 TaxID=743299 RepID=G0JTT3_9PROT|nr:Lytic transglycosylase catalytic [Acidithiobacillus ferrivorans SS3]